MIYYRTLHRITFCYTVLILLGLLRLNSGQFAWRYTEKLTVHETVIPRKVDEDGSFISHFIPHFFETDGRRKRDILSDQLLYIVPIDGIEHRVHLWPNSDFLAPGLVIEEHSFDRNSSKINVRKRRSMQCHYTGVVQNLKDSRVALSTCYGLAGSISIPGNEYLIEPYLNDNRLEEYHKHFIYKRSKDNENFNFTNCGTKGKFKKALEERLEWEMKYGDLVEKSSRNQLFEDMMKNNTRLMPVKRSADGEAVTDTCETTTCEEDLCPCPERKCQPRNNYYLEILIVVDYTVDKLYVEDLETFILTIFNMVSSNFHDYSIGYPIHMSLVRLIYFSDPMPFLDIRRFAPTKLLEQFCDWQLSINPLSESHPNHHDFAIFITRFEPCQGKILGLTNMASVCRLDKSCTVVSEEGLLLANIITHQIGHSLGAEHDDGEAGGCAGEEPDGTRYHMNPIISMSSTEWSVCSKQCIMQFLSSRMSWCLVDAPDEHDFNFPEILPGQIYDAVQQCSLNFKMRTLACRTGDFCKELYCQITSTKCASTGDPPAPGTPCAVHSWCFGGNCVQRGQRPGSVHGQWGPWASWSPCTRSCGGGVQSRFRNCNNPAPSHGGSYCYGPWTTFRMCSIKPCIGYLPSFIQLQCKMTDKRAYKGRNYMWNYFKTHFDDVTCTLICMNEKMEISIRSPVVIDGTPCKPGTNNVCVEGVCRHVGCDWVIDSTSKEDMCGICHGGGTGCKVVQGTFAESNVRGMVQFLKLPAGTSMIYIRELDVSSCYLIVSSGVNSTFYLNAPTLCDALPGSFHFAGVSAIYDNKLSLERIFIRRPIDEPLVISVKCREDINYGIRYQYALPEVDYTYQPFYSWEYLYWQPCSRVCSGGTQRTTPACVEARGGEVDDRFCLETTKPKDIIRVCNMQPCSAKWWVGPWADCDCCDGEGIMTRVVFCMKAMSEDNSITKVVSDKECCLQPKPRIQKPCSRDKDADINMPRRKREKSIETFKEDKIGEYEESPSYDDTEPPKRNKDLNLEQDYHVDIDPNFDLAYDMERSSEDKSYLTETESQNLKRKGQRSSKKSRLNRARTTGTDKSNDNKISKVIDNYINDVSEKDKVEDEDVNSSTKLKKDSSSTEGFFSDEDIERLLKDESLDSMSNITQSEEVTVKPVRKSLIVKEVKLSDGNITVSTVASRPAVTLKVAKTSKVCMSTKSSEMESSSCSRNFFIGDDINNIFWTPKSTTCDGRNSGVEPADLGPRLETGNSSAYKLIIIPLMRDPDTISRTDPEVQVFGDSIYWPIAGKEKPMYLSGETMFKTLHEASRRGTRPAPIDVESAEEI